MRVIKYLLLTVLVLSLSSCREKEFGPSSFGLSDQVYGTVLFGYGAQKQFNMTAENIKISYVKCFKGWTGQLEGSVLTITAPEKDTEHDISGKVGLYARGYDDVEYVLWIEVEVTEDAKEGQPAGFFASFEEVAEQTRLWQNGDAFRVYDEYDSDGFEFKPVNAIPESGLAEVQFNGLLSDNTEKAYAVYPSDKTLTCTAEGVVSGLSLSSEQTGVVDGYADSLYVAFSCESDGKMEFQAPYVWFKIELVDNGVKKVVVTDIDGECALAGKYAYDITAMHAEMLESVSSITLTPSEDNATLSSGIYYLVALPDNLSGIKVSYETAEGLIIDDEITASEAIARNAVVDLGKIKTSKGTGVEADPYLLSSVSDLKGMSDKLTDDSTVYFKLVKDIDLTDVDWTPVSNGKATVHFDGNGKTISNLTCSTGKASFFGKLSGSCSNVSFVEASITGTSDICGIVAGEANAVISDVYVSGTVTSGLRRTGGLIGYLTGGSLSGCRAKVSVSNTSGVSVGGFVGGQSDTSEPITISNCQLLAESSVVGTGEYVGGIIGYFTKGKISGCSVTGATITGNAGYVGGIVGYSKGDIEGCVSKSTTVACASKKNYAGGVVGNSAGAAKISKCALEGGSVRSYRMSGGIVGYVSAETTIENSYSLGCTIEAANRRAGGIVGELAKDKALTVSNCYSTATCKAQYAVAGIVAFEDPATTEKSSYSGCVAWNEKLEQTETAYNVTYYSGAILGNASRNSALQNCYRKSGLNFVVPTDDRDYQPVDQENCDGTTTLLTEGTYADDGYGWKYLYPYHGMSTDLATVSDVAKSLSWDEAIWNLDEDFPLLK